MLLVVDVGNTQTHFGTFRGEELVEHWRFATVRTSTADELGAALRNLLELRGVGLADLRASIVSSTVPQLEPEWVAIGERYLGHRMLSVGPGLKIDNPRELGADRIVNAVAAYDQLGGPCIAVDFGTATTFDVVNAHGEYEGGVIMPGMEISLDALTSRGAKLPRLDLTAPRQTIGKGTVDAIRAGMIFGYAAAIDGIVSRIRAELADPDVPTIATGGLGPTVVPHTEQIDGLDDLLTLKGLKLLHERNS